MRIPFSLFQFIIPDKLEILVNPLLVENIIKLETTRSKLLRRPSVLLFVIGNLKKHIVIPFPVSQILSFYKTDLPIRRADSAHYVTANLRRLLVHNCKIRALNYIDVVLKRVVLRFHSHECALSPHGLIHDDSVFL